MENLDLPAFHNHAENENSTSCLSSHIRHFISRPNRLWHTRLLIVLLIILISRSSMTAYALNLVNGQSASLVLG